MVDFKIPDAAIAEISRNLVPRILPEKAYNYLSAFLPGMIFEIAVSMGNLDLAQDVAFKYQTVLNLVKTGLVILIVMLAFIIGNGFMLLVGIIERFLGHVCRATRYLSEKLCVHILLPSVISVRL